VKHLVLSLIADGDSGFDRDFEDTRATFVVKQHAGEVESLYDTFNHGVRTFAVSLHTQSTTAMHELSHHCIRKPRFDLVAQRLAFHLKRRHADRFKSSGKLIFSHRFVALSKTGDEEEH